MRITFAEHEILSYVRRHYPSWVSEIETASDSRAIRYDGVRVQTSNQGDSTYELALRVSEYQDKVRLVDGCLKRIYVTDERVQRMRRAFCFNDMSQITKNEYYETRQILAEALIEAFGERMSK